jgi:hypothetical protein
MAESVNVSGPIDIRSDSRQRVAYDLMDKISRYEEGRDNDKKRRDYWLTLYNQCYKAASGSSLQSTLKAE